MKIPTTTKGRHWIELYGQVTVEAFLVLLCFLAGPPLSYLGLVIIAIAWIEQVGAVILAVKDCGKKNDK